MRILSILLVLATFAHCKSVTAAANAADVQAYMAAGKQLSDLIAQADAAARPADLHLKEVSTLVREFANEDRMLAGPALPVSDLGVMGEICGLANNISMSLAWFGAKARIDPQLTPERSTAALVALMQENGLQFQDALQEIQSFHLRCLAKQIPALEQFTISLAADQITDVRKDGLSMMRSGLLQAFGGVVGTVQDSRYSAENRLALTLALSDSAPEFVKVIPLTVRRQISDEVAKVAARVPPPYRQQLESISQTFRNETCDMLCSIH